MNLENTLQIVQIAFNKKKIIDFTKNKISID